ncbi:kynureninase [Lottiidibacillus patelloidae]|uniref:Kynureninase n=1 Tax=Lottiidibacillus patelloidae TaxID=2670334 RepID=A0A263BT06_9BACI|nr:kynureninase [Lottiidibacillus patelloidae]OZM56698.1 kynureninase [Lottiidibacillus patelloidae]
MNKNSFQLTESFAMELDKADVLNKYRDEFYLQPNSIYMDGNSLGLISKRAEKTLLESIEDWKTLGIDGWLEGKHPWFYLSERLGSLTAPLVGALTEEVIVTGSTTVNLHQLVATFYQPKGKRTKILADELNFPSDIYALQSQLKLKGYDPNEHLVRVESRDGRLIEEDDIIAAMSDEIALIILPTVLYRSGQLLDMERLTKEAHDRGILIGFDGCHSVGAIPHELSKWGVDFAYWCNYKYLNSGPGGVASLYVNKKHFNQVPGLTGWFGSSKDKQFDMEHIFTPAEHAGAFQIGTPHVFSTAPLLGSLEIFTEATIDKVREKSLYSTAYMMYLMESELAGLGFEIGNPRDDVRRGGHVCLEHKEAARICKALKANGVIPDFRSPNIIRLAPIALYNTYHDVWKVIQILKRIMNDKEYEKFENKRGVVA